MVIHIKKYFKSSALVKSIQFLPTGPRKKLYLLVAVQISLGILDLFAIGLVGLLGILSVSYIQSNPLQVSRFVSQILQLLQLENTEIFLQISVLATLTTILFSIRTGLSIFLTRRAFFFLGTQAAKVSSNLVEKLLVQPLTFLQSRTSQELIFATTTSANALILGVLGTYTIMVADLAMLLIIGSVLFYVSPIVATTLVVLLGILVVALQHFTTSRAMILGQQSSDAEVESRDLIHESIATYRDMRLRGSHFFYSKQLHKLRLRAAHLDAQISYIPNISKYILEAAVIIAALFICLIQFAISDARQAVGILVLFMAAGARLGPAIIRLQQNATSLTWNIGRSYLAMKLGEELKSAKIHDVNPITFSNDHKNFSGDVSISDISFYYPNMKEPAIQNLKISLAAGKTLALVGPSGSGKSTATDLLLGVLKAQQGNITISGMAPERVTQIWPGAIGYVPQDVWLANKSVRRNITLGFADEEVPEEAIWKSLQRTNLLEVIQSLPQSLDTVLGERGAKLSGGQRQRLGIARALLTEPKLLVLDEATSSLDAINEQFITESIKNLHGEVTVVIIAHRLATVRNADLVVYLDHGRIIASGTFEEIRKEVPDFDKQAKLLGL